MLFFKDLLKEKLSDHSFNKFFNRECHICATTMAIVSRLDQDAGLRSQVLSAVNMSREAYERLVTGDECNPPTTIALCRELGMEPSDMETSCPRWKQEP